MQGKVIRTIEESQYRRTSNFRPIQHPVLLAANFQMSSLISTGRSAKQWNYSSLRPGLPIDSGPFCAMIAVFSTMILSGDASAAAITPACFISCDMRAPRSRRVGRTSISALMGKGPTVMGFLCCKSKSPSLVSRSGCIRSVVVSVDIEVLEASISIACRWLVSGMLKEDVDAVEVDDVSRSEPDVLECGAEAMMLDMVSITFLIWGYMLKLYFSLGTNDLGLRLAVVVGGVPASHEVG